jgi:response regulator RpfG family c-di-GMP phosphodiesterase
MVVDDDNTIVQLLRRVLEKENYNVEPVNNGVEALGILNERSHEFDIVLVDLMMPGITGIHLLQRIKELDETLIPIIITGNATIDNAVDSLRCGAYDFIQKPFQIKYVYAVVERALEYRRTLVENLQYEHQLLEMVQERSARISENLRELKESYRFTLEALVGMLDVRERYSGVHSKRVRDFTVVLANEYDLTSDQIEDIAHGALLHDLGKIGIPDSILQKRSPLEPSEWEIMKRHPEIGYSILKNSSFLKEAAEMVYSHHEWYDGTGYPRGLKGKEICLGARIFSLADAYDAMRTNRSYRKSIPLEDVVREIRAGSGTQFDPRVVRVFLAKVDELERILHRMLENYADENE